MTPNEALTEFRRRHPPRTVQVGPVTWRYKAAGTGPGLLLLHGMAGSADIWFQQFDALSHGHRIVAVTYPIVGSLAELRAGIDAVMDTEGVERFSVLGTSLGGYLAQYLVGREPDRIERAIFANTFPPNDIIVRSSNALARAVGFLPNRLVGAFLRRNATRNLVPAADGSPLLDHMLQEQFSGPDVKRSFLARYRCVVEPFDAPSPAMPVTIFESDNDPLVAEPLRRLLRTTYPDAPVRTFTGAGHFPYVNRPDEYAAAIQAALE